MTTGAQMEPYYRSEDGAVELWCGDCHDLMPIEADAIIADPPYGIDHDTDYSRFRGCGTGRKEYSRLRKTHKSITGDTGPFDPTHLLSHPNCVLFGANCYSDKLPCGSWLIWDKRTTAGSTLLSDAEVAWWSKGHGVYVFSHCWSGFARASETGEHYHPTQKPVALMQWVIEKVASPGAVVIDPYMGSGPVGVACVKTGRRFIGIEISEEYCRVAVKRIKEAQSQPSLPLLGP